MKQHNFNRRQILTALAGSAAAASLTAASGKIAGEIFNTLSKFEPLEYDEYNAPPGNSETLLISDISDEKVTDFCTKYDITRESAGRLVYDKNTDRANLIGLGAGSTSLLTDTLKDQFKLPKLGNAIGAFGGEAAGRVFPLDIPLIDIPLVNNNLTSPAFVEREYGMTSANAEKFCEEHKADLRDAARIGGISTTLLKLYLSHDDTQPEAQIQQPQITTLEA